MEVAHLFLVSATICPRHLVIYLLLYLAEGLPLNGGSTDELLSRIFVVSFLLGELVHVGVVVLEEAADDPSWLMWHGIFLFLALSLHFL